MNSLKLTELTHRNHGLQICLQGFSKVPGPERGTTIPAQELDQSGAGHPHISCHLAKPPTVLQIWFCDEVAATSRWNDPMPTRTLWTSSWRLAARVSYVFICHFSGMFRMSGRCPEFHAPCRGKPHIWSLLPEAMRPMRKMRSLQSARIPLTMLAFAWKILTASSISAGLMTDSDYKRFELIIQTA